MTEKLLTGTLSLNTTNQPTARAFRKPCQFMYLVLSLLVLMTRYGIWLYQFLIIAYLFTSHTRRNTAWGPWLCIEIMHQSFVNSPAKSPVLRGPAESHSPALYKSKFLGVYLRNITSPALTRYCGGTQKVIAPHIGPAIPVGGGGGGGGGQGLQRQLFLLWCIILDYLHILINKALLFCNI